MSDCNRVGFGVGTLALAACAAVVLAGVGCSGSSDAGEVQDEDVTAATPPPNPPPPAPVTPPAPAPGPKADAGAPDGATPAPVDPGFRTMWAVDDANRLVRFTSKEPGKVTTLQVTGMASAERVLGIDFRPADGNLYALGSSSRLYMIDRTKGTAKAVGSAAFAPGLSGTAFGFDVNPVADKMRVHSDADQNLRLDPVMGTATIDGALTFAAGDKNAGQSPNLIATAYTNSVSPKPAATELYAIDSTRNLLTKLASPNDGKVTTIGSLGVDVSNVAGFDIWGGAPATGPSRPLQAYALLMTGDAKAALHTIDLAKGTATMVGVVGHPMPIRGLAIEP